MSASSPNQSSLATGAPWDTPWPESEVESVRICPVCGGSERTIIHEKLVDNVFLVAPGKWTLHRCSQCNSAYLDPRPNPESIGKAYVSYYTHTVGSSQARSFSDLGFLGRLRRMMANGYLNHRYGTQRLPASGLGKWVAKVLPGPREVLDVEFRYLPKPINGQRLLDIGCGNGDFLLGAREAGWHVSGVETDPKAADTARQSGANVIAGSVDALAGESNAFDAITLNHVIEHVHAPKQLLQAVQRLLKPGGIVYIETPNINSHGATLFKENWRGIEAPRHLVLFNPASLVSLLVATGFENIHLARRTSIQKAMYLSSLRLAVGDSKCGPKSTNFGWFDRFRQSIPFTRTDHLEFITLTARKPSA